MYIASEGGQGDPMPACLVTVDKYLAKTMDMWNRDPEKWKQLRDLEPTEDRESMPSQENLSKIVANARALPQSSNAQLLALAKCHMAELSTVAKTDAAEMVVEQLVTIVPKRLKAEKYSPEGRDQLAHELMDYGALHVQIGITCV
eukprot:g2835.t1